MATAFSHHTNDHELVIDSTTRALELMRDEDGRALYTVSEELPVYQNPLTFSQTTWTGGHRQRDFFASDKYYEGQSIDTTQDGRIILGPKIYSVGISGGTLGAEPKHFIWFNSISKWICATNTKVFWYDGTNFVEKTEIAGQVISSLAVVADILYVCLGTSTRYYYTADGTTYTQTDLTDGYAEKIIAAPNSAGTATILWKYKKPNQISNTTDGRTAAAGGVQWSSPAYIGDVTYDITNIFLANDLLMVGKEDNLYHYDSNGGVHPLMNDLNRNYSSINFKYSSEWQSSVYFSLVDGLKELTTDTLDSMGPTQEATDIGALGTCVGVVGDKDFLYVAMKDVVWQFPYTFPFEFSVSEDVTINVYKGIEHWTPRGFEWSWCPWAYIGNNLSSTLAICQISDQDRRLWFGYGNYAGYVLLSNNPTATDSLARFASSGWLRMSYIWGTNIYWDKLFQSIVTHTKSCEATVTITPKYRKDTDTTATTLTASITANGVIKTNFTSPLSCKRIQFEVDLASDTDTKTPEILLFQARGIEKPETVRIHEAVYKAASKPSITTTTVRNFLRDGRNSTSLIKFADLRYGQSTAGTDYQWVIIEPGYPKEVEITHEKGRQPELGIQVRMREVSYTIS